MSVSIQLCDTCGREDKGCIWNDFATGPFGSFATKKFHVCDACARDLGSLIKARVLELREQNTKHVPSRIPSVNQIMKRWLKL